MAKFSVCRIVFFEKMPDQVDGCDHRSLHVLRSHTALADLLWLEQAQDEGEADLGVGCATNDLEAVWTHLGKKTLTHEREAVNAPVVLEEN